MSDSTLDRACRQGEFRRLHRGVFAISGAPQTERQACIAAVDAVAPAAYLSGPHALRLLGFQRHSWGNGPIEVVATRRHRPVRGVRIVRTSVLDDEDWTNVDGISVLRLERLLVERAASGATEDVLCALMDEGAYLHQFVVARMRRVIARCRTRTGIGRVRRALDLYLNGDNGAHSALEARVGQRVLAVVTGAWERNRRRTFGGIRMRPDILLPDIGLAIEIDGMHGHARPTRQRQDRQRNAAYRRAGITPMRVRDTHLDADVAAVVAEIERRQRAPR